MNSKANLVYTYKFSPQGLYRNRKMMGGIKNIFIFLVMFMLPRKSSTTET